MGHTCRVRTCCGFVSLEKGAAIIGIFSLVSSCVGVATLSRNLAADQDAMATQILSKASIEPNRVHSAISYIRWSCVGLLLMSIACLFSSIGLIWGIKKCEQTYVIPWVASNSLHVSYNLVITLVASVKLYSWQVPFYQVYIGCMIFWDAAMLVMVYWIVVVWSYYKKHRDHKPSNQTEYSQPMDQSANDFTPSRRDPAYYLPYGGEGTTPVAPPYTRAESPPPYHVATLPSSPVTTVPPQRLQTTVETRFPPPRPSAPPMALFTSRHDRDNFYKYP